MERGHAFLVCGCILMASVAATGCAGITSFTPSEGLPGTVVDIRGKGFSATWNENDVTIGGVRARVIEGSSTRLRVVALRDLATGKIEVRTPSRTIVSRRDFTRRGDTLSPAPDKRSGPELIEGRQFPLDRRYDMAAQGNNQKVLVVLAKPNDIDPELAIPMWANAEVGPFANAREFVDRLLSHPDRGVNRYFTDASYGKLSGDFRLTPDWIPLSQPWDFYCWGKEDVDNAQAAVDVAQNDLNAVMVNPSAGQADIDAAQGALASKKEKLKLAQDSGGFLQQADFLFAEALLGAKAALGAAFDDYTDHVFIVAGPGMRGSCCWNGTGFHAESANPAFPLGPFDIDFPAPRGGTWVAEDAWPGRIAHELSHFFASGDLYDGSASDFDLMGNHDRLPVYSAYNMNLKGDWVDAGNVVELQWGDPGDRNEVFDLVPHGRNEDPPGDSAKHLIRLRVTEGLYYFVEVRQRPDPAVGLAGDYPFDTAAPTSEAVVNAGVLVTKVVEGTNQTNNREPSVTLVPPEAAARRTMSVGEVFTDPARTIRISVVSRSQDRPAKYQVRVEWGHVPAADPNGQFDLRITPWATPPWETVDIWANSTKNDTTAPAAILFKNHEPGDETKPIGNGDPPWVNHDNTLFARITNQGLVETPEDVRVTFYVNTPPGVGDNGNWGPFDTVVVGRLAAGETRIVPATRPWRPSVGEHTCVKVQVEPMMGEVTFDNNQAQENFGEFEAEGSSPHRAVEFDVVARNPYDHGAVMDIMARDVPKDWFVALDQGAVWLPPKGEKKVHAVVWTDRVPEWEHDRPKEQGPRKAMINIEGWMNRPVDRIHPVGGVTALVQAVRKVQLSVNVRQKELKVGERLGINGQLSPGVQGAPIAIHLRGPNGAIVVERAVSDSTGAFSHVFSSGLSVAGDYRVEAFVLGGAVAAETQSAALFVRVR